MSKHRTAKGRDFNMQAFADGRGETVAVGNSLRNARGDLLGAGGKVVATAKQITANVYNKANKPVSKSVKLNPMEQEVRRTEVVGADGVSRWEVTFADGSIEIQEQEVDLDSVKPVQQEKKKPKNDIDSTTNEEEL
jgi:hypothetical protein